MKLTKSKISVLALAAIVVSLFAICTTVYADVYMLNFRGSNNRLNGNQRPRNNAQRLFDSQNNEYGGHNVGNLYYYEGSVVTMEWTAQHSCGNANNHCEFIIQYMCDDKLRDGTTETAIGRNQDDNYRFGRQESSAYYDECATTSRNRGLYTSDQLTNANRKFAINTRQNAAGTRYAYECPEERDYYPYWRPTPWTDVAILTSQPSRCSAYQAESENIKGRGRCRFLGNNKNPIPITQETCESQLDDDGVGGVWEVLPAKNQPAPDCLQTMFTRDNHLGNTVGGFPLRYNWTIPSNIHQNCALRIRYNITAYDHEGWENSTSVQAGWTYNNNSGDFPLERYNFPTVEAARARGYYLTGNPQVDIFGSWVTAADPIKFEHNVNTNQYSRTFEDRSHRFSIHSREGKYPQDAVIHNINVGGKRGNVVQTFPSTEYTFMPAKIDITTGDYIHFQWTGSNSNPGNNDGQGQASTDRSNVCMIRNQTYIDTTELTYSSALTTFGHQAANYPAVLSDDPLANFLGWDKSTLTKLALLTTVQNGGDMEELDDAGTYFDLPPKQVARLGNFNYLCTRNNNFSNRSQKGIIRVAVSRAASQILGSNGGKVIAQKASKSSLLKTAEAQLSVAPEQFVSATPLSLTIAPGYILRDYNVDRSNIASDVVFVSTNEGEGEMLPGKAVLTIKHDGSPISNNYIAFNNNMELGSTAKNVKWQKLDTTNDGSTASAVINRPGTYVVKSELNVGIVIAIVVACFVAVVGAIALIVFCKKRAAKTALALAGADKV